MGVTEKDKQEFNVRICREREQVASPPMPSDRQLPSLYRGTSLIRKRLPVGPRTPLNPTPNP